MTGLDERGAAARHDGVVLRAAILALAVVVCAWFALGVRQATDTRDATPLIDGQSRLDAARARHAASLLHAAGQLNPDAQVDILRGELALQQGNVARAQRILDDVTRREPDNLNAWIWLAHASPHDPATFRRALAHARRLVPAVPSP
jgi:Tfp pilus assembly protein PilF